MKYVIKNNNKIVEEVVKPLEGLTFTETIIIKLITNDGNYIDFGNQVENEFIFVILRKPLEKQGWKFDKDLSISSAAFTFTKNNNKLVLGFDNVLHYNPKPVFRVNLNK